MLTLCGFALSNYFNKVKMILLEKGVPFEEERVLTGRSDEDTLTATPLGKIPFLRTPRGTLCESQVIAEYLEATCPQPPLLPADPWQAAKVRELTTFIELHLELVARQLYAEAFFGGKISDGTRNRVHKELVRNIAGFKRLARFAPYVAGESFTLADCAAYQHLPLVGMASKIIYGEDLLAGAGVDWKSYVATVGARPSAQKVAADRKADQQRSMEQVRAKGG